MSVKNFSLSSLIFISNTLDNGARRRWLLTLLLHPLLVLVLVLQGGLA